MVGFLYEIDRVHLPPRTPVHLIPIRVAMVCEKTDLNIFQLQHKGNSSSFVMETALAAKVLHRKVPAEEYSYQKHLESFWAINSSAVNSLKNDSSFTKNVGPCSSDLVCKL
ncbi:unnamed protein product [Fraxinus pennsylvanica]|uniref:Uncharacterized protein n=1 Tax=Fraxinus pennsylvanica TaxID=56036 RepID=A0AAD1YMD8_9LAMI|nr:unnamed protein product [Fraxinus pennsylvanica]